MVIHPIKTPKILPGAITLTQLLDASLPRELAEGSVLAITSKIVSWCEGRVVPMAGADKEALVRQEADRYLPAAASRYGLSLSITGDTLIPAAGIDESNGNGHYILWPADVQATTNQVRQYLVQRFGLHKVGVVITDSACLPLRWGTTGIALAHSGFRALNNYIGQPDLFGRPYAVSQSNVAGGLAAAATLAMGEGAEQTPIVTLEELPFVSFQPRDPSPKELASLRIAPEEDLYAPLIMAVDWLPGGIIGGN